MRIGRLAIEPALGVAPMAGSVANLPITVRL